MTPLPPDSPNRAETIFHGALDIPAPRERAEYLDAACAGDAALRAEVEGLLRAEESQDFLNGPAVAGATAILPATEQSGERIGRYRLLQQIGEGGFGTVWMAEQVEPVTRRVALKIIKAGMDTKEVIARFEAERQALAMMDHPHIAKVLDAGATDKGRPFFVMELVKGIPITRFCDERELTTRQRLELFADVCSAINHAHQKGVIHRDIKPSNVMVTLSGDRPVVKVIDFGIAKATQGRLTDRTLFTRFEQFLGTPAYMSPEQAAIADMDIDTRSDIYALGVLLYELLTSKPPFDAQSLLSAGYEEMRRIIREVEPPKPSTRLMQLTATSPGTAPATIPKSSNPKSKIPDDLDWIVMKAIEKDRARRYETANGLALDIQRFLSDEPVSAGAPSAAYRFRKYARRHKAVLRVAALAVLVLVFAAILSTALIAAVLVAATLVSVWQAVRAKLAENRATEMARDERAAREDAEAVCNFLADLFQRAEPARDGPGVTILEILDRAAAKLDADLVSHPRRRARMQSELGCTCFALGRYESAMALLGKAHSFYTCALGPEHPDTLSTLHRLANSCHAAGRLKEARRMREEVMALRRKVFGLEHPQTLWAMHTLANSYHNTGRLDDALQMRETLLSLFRRVIGPEHPDLHMPMSNLATSYQAIGRFEEAIRIQEEVFALRRKILGGAHPDTLGAMTNLAISYHKTGRRDDALKLQEEVVALSDKVNGSKHPDTLAAMTNLGWNYHDAKSLDNDAISLLEKAWRDYLATLGRNNPATLNAMSSLGKTYRDAGRLNEGCQLLQGVVAERGKVLGAYHPDTLIALYNLAVGLQKQGKLDEARKYVQQALRGQQKVLGSEHRDTKQSKALLQELLSQV